MPKSPEEYAHLEWLGYVQPLGLVVSIPAMLAAQCYVNKNIMGEHARFLSCLPRDKSDEVVPEIGDLPELTRKVLGWEEEDLVTIPQGVAMPEEYADLEVVLPQYHETLRPTHVVPRFQTADSQQTSTDNQEPATSNYVMLIQELATGIELDEAGEADSSRHWNAAPQAKFERLLREAEVPIGLLSNGRQLRLVYSPRGETSGHATFNVDEMIQVAGRPMFAALHMLLCNDRMFSVGENQRLPAILENSRKYQNTVSTALAEQVLAALYELMRGFQGANDVRKGELLRDVLANDPNHVYAGQVQRLIRIGHPLLLIAVRNIFAGVEDFGSRFGRSVQTTLNQVFAKLLLLFHFPMEANDLLARQTHQRIAVTQGMVQKREGVVFGQRHQP